MDEHKFLKMNPREKVLHVLQNLGQQSSEELCKSLNMKKKNLDSILSRLYIAGKVERVAPGTYRIKN